MKFSRRIRAQREVASFSLRKHLGILDAVKPAGQLVSTFRQEPRSTPHTGFETDSTACDALRNQNYFNSQALVIFGLYLAWERWERRSALRLRCASAIARNCGFRSADSPASRHSRKTGCISPVVFEGASESVCEGFPVVGSGMMLR